MAPLNEFSSKDLLAAVRRLPAKAQAELAGALLCGDRGVPPAGVEPLLGMTEGELRVLAEAVVSHGHQRRLKVLLRKNREGSLNAGGVLELDNLLAECDRVALLKARAEYTLSVIRANSTKAA
ncbi:MAG: hypothetical protein IPK82_09725 [Polyangiaceae bacterium]|nr:hypothetical protein [Polyangiaceae bacterium]